ncbi:MAG: helix-turn-helix transcriptional regulator [Polaromonas sp.]|nr:helix-turn-helix transcriptional regulator [Polaromonas sp.]
MINITAELVQARKSANLSQDELATRAGLSRMTVQRTESGQIDPRVSSLLVMAQALGLDLMLVPLALRPELEAFVRSGGRFLGQATGAAAPPSVAETLAPGYSVTRKAGA